MSHYDLNSLLLRVKNEAAYRERFIAGREEVLASWSLSDEECAAIRDWDLTRMNELGAYMHLVLLANLALQHHPRDQTS